LQYRVQKAGNDFGRQLAAIDGVFRCLAGSLEHARPPVPIVDLVAEESKQSELNPTAGYAYGDHGHERTAARRAAAMSVAHTGMPEGSPLMLAAFMGQLAFLLTTYPGGAGFVAETVAVKMSLARLPDPRPRACRKAELLRTPAISAKRP